MYLSVVCLPAHERREKQIWHYVPLNKIVFYGAVQVSGFRQRGWQVITA